MLLFDLESDFSAEGDLLRHQHHGDDCLLGRTVCELGSCGPDRGRGPSSGLGRGLRRDGEDWSKASKNQRIWGHSPPNPPSRPPVKDPVRDVGDCGFQGEDVGDDSGHVDCHYLVSLVADAGSQNADGGYLDGCGCFICMDFVHLQARSNLRFSPIVQALYLHMHMGLCRSTLCFFAWSDALPTHWSGALPKVHDCDDLLEANLMPHVLRLHQRCEEVSNPILISCCGYGNLIFHHIYMEIFESDFQPIDHAARRITSVNLWSKVNIIVTILQYTYVRTHELSIKGSPIDRHEQICPTCSCYTRSYLMDGTIVEDTVPLLFGLCHRRWTTTPPLLILRFNRGDLLRLSSVKATRYLQLNTHKPQVHTPDRPLGESPAGHQLVWSTKEALEDCNCSKFEPGLLPDKRPMFDSNCSLRYLLCKPRSSRICSVQLNTYGSCSSVSFVILYYDR